MQRKNRILSLVDFSEYSETIIRYTHRFSTYLQADVVLIHQLPGIVPSRASTSVREQIYKAEREDANEQLFELANPHFETMPAIICGQTDLSETLRNLKNDTFFDWLFVGLKGTSFIEQIFLGSKAVEVLDESDLVSLAFPLTKEIYFPEELVVALHDDSPLDSTHLKAVLSQLSERVKKITFFMVKNDKERTPESEAVFSRLVADFSTLKPSTIVFDSNNVLHEIENFMKEKVNSYLVIQEGNPSLQDAIFHKGVVNELVYKSTIPMIILPYKAKQGHEDKTISTTGT